MISGRTKSILEAGIREFIETGEPITSEKLYKKYDFGIKQAMIRWELHDLAEAIYFLQQHPSGGRIPSDKAYRFFVKEIVSGMERERLEEEGETEEIARYFARGENAKFVKQLAESLGVFGLCYEQERNMVHRSGIAELFEAIEMGNREEMRALVEDLDKISDRMEEKKIWWEEETEWPQVFIGKSPFTKSNQLSVVIRKISKKETGNVIVMAIGPKRMDYETSLKLFEYLNQLI